MNELTVQNKQTAVEVRAQVNLIQEVMKSVMKENTHYGVIPGCNKPTLYKAGAEVLATTFRLAVDPQVDDLSVLGEIRYRIKARLTNINDGNFVGNGVGECSTNEEKYKWRKAVCEAEFEETEETSRREKWVGAYKERKEYQIKQVRTNPADLANTVLKMAKKRAQIDAILTATAASDIFTQDIEDLPEEIQREVASDTEQPSGKPKTEPPKSKSNGDVISVPQGKRFFAICKGAGMEKEDMEAFLLFNYELNSSRDIPKEKYDEICTAAGEWKK